MNFIVLGIVVEVHRRSGSFFSDMTSFLLVFSVADSLAISLSVLSGSVTFAVCLTACVIEDVGKS